MNPRPVIVKQNISTAILVDGGFYLKRANSLFNEKDPVARADELFNYCMKHIKHKPERSLYRIFYYDCPPATGVVFNPITREHLNLEKQPIFEWMNTFHSKLTQKRKLALRLGELSRVKPRYYLKPDALKDLANSKRTVQDLSNQDLWLNIQQKGVDVKLGMDIASLAYEGIVNQIIMITGDTDFVPAAKVARRKGIDFILDPMWQHISPSLSIHIDGIESACKNPEEG